MDTYTSKIKTIDDYILQHSIEIQEILSNIRSTIKKVAPSATESISYGMPAFTLNGPLVYFAAFKKHIGFYPIPSGIEAFKKQLSDYKTTKGAVQFPLTKPIPYDLIQRIVEFRMNENAKKVT